MRVDEKNNEVFSQEILDDVNEVLETMKTPPEDESDHTIAEAYTPFLEPTEDIVNFCRFENIYKKVLTFEDQLLCPEVQAQLGDEHSKLKNSFEHFQRKLRFMTRLKSEH